MTCPEGLQSIGAASVICLPREVSQLEPSSEGVIQKPSSVLEFSPTPFPWVFISLLQAEGQKSLEMVHRALPLPLEASITLHTCRVFPAKATEMDHLVPSPEGTEVPLFSPPRTPLGFYIY